MRCGTSVFEEQELFLRIPVPSHKNSQEDFLRSHPVHQTCICCLVFWNFDRPDAHTYFIDLVELGFWKREQSARTLANSTYFSIKDKSVRSWSKEISPTFDRFLYMKVALANVRSELIGQSWVDFWRLSAEHRYFGKVSNFRKRHI
jgi:hypothetical protein